MCTAPVLYCVKPLVHHLKACVWHHGTTAELARFLIFLFTATTRQFPSMPYVPLQSIDDSHVVPVRVGHVSSCCQCRRGQQS